MLRGLGAIGEAFLSDLGRIEARQRRVQRDISSGYKVLRPSDAPRKIMNLVELRADISRAATSGDNLLRVEAEVDTAEASLRVAVQLMERARVLAAQGASATSTNRTTAAIETRQIHEQIVSLTHAASEGRFVFSGDADQQVLYEANWSQPSGVARTATADNTRLIEDANGTRFSVSKSAHHIFDERDGAGVPTAENVFEALHSLTLALEADDKEAVMAAVPKIASALEHLNRDLAFYGHAQNRVALAKESASGMLLAKKAELSSIQDTDLGEALVELNMASVHQQAALTAHSKLPRTSLFDFLG